MRRSLHSQECWLRVPMGLLRQTSSSTGGIKKTRRFVRGLGDRVARHDARREAEAAKVSHLQLFQSCELFIHESTECADRRRRGRRTSHGEGARRSGLAEQLEAIEADADATVVVGDVNRPPPHDGLRAHWACLSLAG